MQTPSSRSISPESRSKTRARITVEDCLEKITNRFQLAGRNLAAAINQLELQLLTFGQTIKARTLNRADVDEDVFAATILLDEAKALGRVEELYGSGAFAHNLGRHAAATGTAAKAAATTAAGTAAEAAAITTTETAATGTAAEAATIATAETVSTAKAITAGEWIEIVFSETVPLVAPASAAPSIKTHIPDQTFASPH